MAASPSPSPELEGIGIGSVLDGRYRIDALIGTGGMGRVFRGEHTGIGRAVAIKVLHADLNRNREASARFQREALASGRLDHPNIVGVSDFGVLEDGACYLVMEILEGESLGDRLARDKRVPWREAVEIMRGVLLGLRHAHERGVVHRDIKPDNIYLARKDGDLVVKILDFGIAKLRAGTADDPAATRAGLTVGTPAYLSPEQAVGGEITPASDLYSSTIVLFEILAGRAPFEDKDPLAMLGAHVSRPPPRISEVAPDVELPAGFEELLAKGLTKAASERFTAANDYLAALDMMLVGRPSRQQLVVEAAPHEDRSSAPIRLGTSPSAGVPAAPSLVGVESVANASSAPHAMRAVTLPGEPEPIPRRWIWTGGLVLLVLVLLAIIVGMATRGEKKSEKTEKSEKSEPPTTAASTKPAPPKPAPPEPRTVPREPTDDDKLKDAIAELTNYSVGCDKRKQAVAKVAAFDTPAAIAALKKARFVGDGGWGGLGVREKNVNWCLVKDVDAALKKLDPPKSK